MTKGLEQLSSYDIGAELFYGCPLSPEELKPVRIDDKLIPGIRPTTPQTYDFKTGLFIPHDSAPVVCAGTDIKVIAFHGLVRAGALHVRPYARRNGWAEDIDGTIGRVLTTQILSDFILCQGSSLKAYVYRLRKSTPPFQPFGSDGRTTATEWRSRTPVPWLDEPIEIDGTDWPADIVDIVEPYPRVQYGERDSSGRLYQDNA